MWQTWIIVTSHSLAQFNDITNNYYNAVCWHQYSHNVWSNHITESHEVRLTHDWPARAKVAVSVGKCWAVLLKETVEWRREALKRHSKHSIQTLKHRQRQRTLEFKTLVRTSTEKCLHSQSQYSKCYKYGGYSSRWSSAQHSTAAGCKLTEHVN